MSKTIRIKSIEPDIVEADDPGGNDYVLPRKCFPASLAIGDVFMIMILKPEASVIHV